jgi:mannose-1-phosphate guanylyltransferase
LIALGTQFSSLPDFTMQENAMYIVILAGGSGTRFWPLSRGKNPKQLMSILGGKSMLQRTVERVLPLSPKRVLIITNSLQAGETARQIEQYRDKISIDIIEEPVGRNTAPAIGLAAAVIQRNNPDALMLVLPADHYIADEEEFRRTVLSGTNSARNGYLVTMGIVPVRPETGYGYIEVEAEMLGDGQYPVKRFVEKPNVEKALEFLESGNFFWNSGMFMWRSDVILCRIREHMEPLASALESLSFSGNIWELSDLKPQIAAIYSGISGESIDYGVMEKADNVVVVPSSFGWSDVGSWTALPEVVGDDDSGNVVINAKGFVNLDSSDCIVYGGGKLVALIDVNGFVIVNTDDALLLCRKEKAQEVKKMVAELESRGLKEYL